MSELGAACFGFLLGLLVVSSLEGVAFVRDTQFGQTVSYEGTVYRLVAIPTDSEANR